MLEGFWITAFLQSSEKSITLTNVYHNTEKPRDVRLKLPPLSLMLWLR